MVASDNTAPLGQQEVAQHIAKKLEHIKQLAVDDDLPMLAYLLETALIEAEEQAGIVRDRSK